MQHHGAPTRLLDWTRSPFVAAYFAFEDATLEGQCAVWAIDHVWLRRVAEPRLRGFLIPGFEADQLKPDDCTDEALNALIVNHNASVVVPVVPRRLGQRLVAQQPVFLVPGNFQKTISENLGDEVDSTNHFVKLEMPGSLRAQALSQLRQMNITRATLFPGLDGFGQSLRYSLQADAGEVMRLWKRCFGADMPRSRSCSANGTKSAAEVRTVRSATARVLNLVSPRSPPNLALNRTHKQRRCACCLSAALSN